jgi:hypothetical protein
MAETGTGRYLYAITRGVGPDAVAGSTGLGGSALEVVDHRGLVAVVSTVRLEEFGEEGLRRNLEDLGWLETVARGHDAVVQVVAAHGPTAPLRLATICLDDDGVRTRLDEWHDQLSDVLDRVQGRVEWSAKTYARESGVAEASAPAAPVEGKGAGVAYLQRKRESTQRRMQSEERAQQLAAEIHAALAQHAVASRRLPAQDPRLTGHEGVMTLNGAYLVPADESDAFAATVAALSQQHPDAHLEAGGPWPPYSFAVLDQS